MLIVRLIWHIFYAQLSKKYLFTFTPQRYNIFSTYANNCLKKAKLCGGHKFAFSFGRDVEEVCEFLRSLFGVPSVGQRKIKRTAILK